MSLPEEVAPDVFLVRGTDVNAYLLRDRDALTLVDAGYPGDIPRITAAIGALGRSPADVRAVLITHAHVDHIGAVEHLAERYGVAAYAGPVEVAHAHRDRLEQAAPRDVARGLAGEARHPRTLVAATAWTLRVMRAGALRPSAAPSVRAAPGDTSDLPGSPVAVAMPGHTSGHTAYLLPALGALITGDGLVTGHPLLPGAGPQLLPALFHHGDPFAGLDAIAELDAGLLLPGHGEPMRVSVRDAVRAARIRAGVHR